VSDPNLPSLPRTHPPAPLIPLPNQPNRFAKSYLARDVCKLGPTIGLLEDIACACGEKRSDCGTEAVKLQRYEATVFGGKKTEIVTKDADIVMTPDNNINAQVFSVPLLNFVLSPELEEEADISGSAADTVPLRALTETCATRQPSEVYYAASDTETPAGQLLGNGFLLKFNTETVQTVMYVCLQRDPTIVECSDKYPVLDFVSADDSGTPSAPLGLTVESPGDGRYCANLTITGNGEYFPIRRTAEVELTYMATATGAPTPRPTKVPTLAPTVHPCESGMHYCWKSTHLDELGASCKKTGGSAENTYTCECPIGFTDVTGSKLFTKTVPQECAKNTLAPTVAPTVAPNVAPTVAPTIDTPADDTPAEPVSTPFPTFAPTKAPKTPEMPVFAASDFAAFLLKLPVDLSSVIVTLRPTVAPTSYPTVEGYAMVAQEKEVTVVSTDISFPLSSEEAANPVMQASLAEGMAASLGFEPEAVAVTHVDGTSVAERRRALGGSRRLNTGADITFGIESVSGDSDQLTKLEDNIKAAATGGAIVANIQKAASDNGVLVATLQNMDRTLPEPVPQRSMKTKTVFEPVRSNTDAPTSAPEDTDAVSTSSSSLGAIIGGVVGGVALTALIGMFLVRGSGGGKEDPAMTPQTQAGV
jgi:hypothetical protein